MNTGITLGVIVMITLATTIGVTPILSVQSTEGRQLTQFGYHLQSLVIMSTYHGGLTRQEMIKYFLEHLLTTDKILERKLT